VLRQTVTSLLESPTPKVDASRWRALLLPHAGHSYSGAVCGIGVASVAWPKTILLLGPNHRGSGAPAALSDATAWRTPLGNLPTSRRLVAALAAEAPGLELDAAAHAKEHALEVILPFLQVVRPDAEIACVSIGQPDFSLCEEIGLAAATAIASLEGEGERVAIVVSSDLSHYLPKKENGKKDERAITAVLEGDPRELFERVLVRERISMCGILPATALLVALKHLPACKPSLLAHRDSSDAGGDPSGVVGYAAIRWTESS